MTSPAPQLRNQDPSLKNFETHRSVNDPVGATFTRSPPLAPQARRSHASVSASFGGARRPSGPNPEGWRGEAPSLGAQSGTGPVKGQKAFHRGQRRAGVRTQPTRVSPAGEQSPGKSAWRFRCLERAGLLVSGRGGRGCREETADLPPVTTGPASCVSNLAAPARRGRRTAAAAGNASTLDPAPPLVSILRKVPEWGDARRRPRKKFPGIMQN